MFRAREPPQRASGALVAALFGGCGACGRPGAYGSGEATPVDQPPSGNREAAKHSEQQDRGRIAVRQQVQAGPERECQKTRMAREPDRPRPVRIEPRVVRTAEASMGSIGCLRRNPLLKRS